MSDINLMTAAEVAERLGVSIKTVARMANAGTLPTAVKAPGLRGARLFDPNDVEAVAAERGAA